MIEIFGLKNCDTCKKAMKALKAAGQDAQILDVRDHPISTDQLNNWLEMFGEALLNTRSTTWRKLSDQERSTDMLELLSLYPALMKRPIIRDSTRQTLGWTKAEQDIWLS